MANEADKIRLPELPIFKKYSLAVRQEYVTPQEVLAALERTTARVQRLIEKGEEDRRRQEEAQRGEAERIALEEQERRWSDVAAAIEEPETEEFGEETEEDIPGTMELEKAEEVAPQQHSSEVAEFEHERPFWEVDDDDLSPPPAREEDPELELQSDNAKSKPKSKAKKAKARPRPQVVQVSRRGKPIINRASGKTQKKAATKRNTRAGAKRKAK